jgi:hypothetical protein
MPNCLQQRTAVGGLLRHGERRGDARAAGVAAPVVAHQTVALREVGLRTEWCVRVGDEGSVDEHYWLTRADDVVLQHGSIDTQPLGQFLRQNSSPSIDS